jgi:predicted ATP-binding protein involved in virulence
MADGYSAFLKIVMELMMRMSNPNELLYEKQGVVLIDEIETHLHVELQKRVMPFLVAMFPNIQFIVSTHSPFVITSLDNAVVFDLENQQRMEDLSKYSYEGIIEYYYNSDMYSQKAKKLFEEYQKLSSNKRSQKDDERFAEIILQLDTIPSAVAPELFLKFKECETKRKERCRD